MLGCCAEPRAAAKSVRERTVVRVCSVIRLWQNTICRKKAKEVETKRLLANIAEGGAPLVLHGGVFLVLAVFAEDLPTYFPDTFNASFADLRRAFSCADSDVL